MRVLDRSACVLAVVVIVALCTSPATAASRHRAALPAWRGISEVHRVFAVVLENEDESRAIEQPFLAQLAAKGALLRNYRAVAHPSQPNYIALISGNTYSVSSDNPVTLSAPHLGDLLDAAGISWKVYAEDYPGDCFIAPSSGDYVRKHVPFLDFADVQFNEPRCDSHILDASQFDADVAGDALPQFALYIPNTAHDGHDTDVATADAWLQSRFGSLVDDPRFMAGTLFVVVFDEGRNPGPNVVYCAFYGAGVQPGTVSDSQYSHYDLLRTIEQIFHTPTLHQQDDAASVISDVWKR